MTVKPEGLCSISRATGGTRTCRMFHVMMRIGAETE